MGYIVCFDGGSQPVPVATSFRFIKWHITEIKNSNKAQHVQMSRINFLDSSDNEYAFDSGIQSRVDNGTIVDGSVANILNDQTNNKVCISWNNTYVDIILDLGIGNELDVATYTQFKWYTANDDQNRDPASWIIYGANHADFDDAVVLNQEIGFQATDTRMTLAYTGSMAIT